MKVGSVTKIGKRNQASSKKVTDDVIFIFPIYFKFEAMQKPDSGV